MHCIHLKNDDIFFFLSDRFGFWFYWAQFDHPFDFKGKHDEDDEQDVDREAGGVVWERLEDVVSFWFTVHLISDICHFFLRNRKLIPRNFLLQSAYICEKVVSRRTVCKNFTMFEK